MSKGWDSGMLKKLKALVGKGMSTSEMGKKLGMSKNAVVGKLNRLGWNLRSSDAEPEKDVKSKKDSKSKTKKNVVKSGALKTVAAKPSKKTVSKVTEKKTTKTAKVAVKAKKAEKTEKTKPAIKTASKKSKRDLALHELLIQHALQMASLKSNQCRWPIGDPDSDDFHFCGETVFTGKPYCYEHCRQAYQFTAPKKK